MRGREGREEEGGSLSLCPRKEKVGACGWQNKQRLKRNDVAQIQNTKTVFDIINCFASETGCCPTSRNVRRMLATI